MPTYRARAADPTKILTRRELAIVLAELKRKAPRSKNTRLNLILFRLAVCCGLRASEIAQLRLGDVRIEQTRPHIRIRRGASKGGRPRTVPLWWDAGTLADLANGRKNACGAPPIPTNRSSCRCARVGSPFPFRGTPCGSGSAPPASRWAPSGWNR